MEEWHKLAKLTCGEYSYYQDIGDIFLQLGNNISKMLRKITNFKSTDEETYLLVAPFFARSILEFVCSALLGRLDPFRLLIVSKIQADNSYDIGARNNGAIQWTGDILAKSKASNPLWHCDNTLEKYNRALFSDHYVNIFWEPAYTRLLDNTSETDGGDWLREYRSTEISGIGARIRQEATRLFTSLSKGICNLFWGYSSQTTEDGRLFSGHGKETSPKRNYRGRQLPGRSTDRDHKGRHVPSITSRGDS